MAQHDPRRATCRRFVLSLQPRILPDTIQQIGPPRRNGAPRRRRGAPRRPEPRFIVPMAVPKQEDTTTSWRRERGPSRRSTAHRLRPLINRQDRIESSTAPACSSADTMSRSHTAPKIVRLRYERRAPCFVPYYTRRRPRRRESHRTQSLKTPSARSRTRP